MMDGECEWEKSADMRGSLMGLVTFEEKKGRPRGSLVALGPLDDTRGRPRLGSMGRFPPESDRAAFSRSSVPDDDRIRSPRSGTPSEDRRVYSPVTFQDIARWSVANSPIKTPSPQGCAPKGKLFFSSK